MRGGWVIAFVLVWFQPGLARQADTLQSRIQQHIEETIEETDPDDMDGNSEQFVLFLQDLSANPVNINRGSLDELLQIPGINLKAARAIIQYRDSKPFEEIDEVLRVKGIGRKSFQRMRPYISVSTGADRFRDMYFRPAYWAADTKPELMSRYQQDLQEKRGYTLPDSSGGYAGSPVKFYQRVRVQSNHYSAHFIQEKDPGESIRKGTGFDFTSGHLALRNNGKLKELVIGDYSLSFGQGLVLWTGGAFGKGREVTGTVGKNERGVRPYTSAGESNYYRGVAATWGEKVQFSVFYSNRPATATVVAGDTTSFPSAAGLHRTPTELGKRNNIRQMTSGGRLRLHTGFGLIGLTGYSASFSSYIAQGSRLSDIHDFEGEHNHVIGIDYRSVLGPVLLFGEIARSKNNGFGYISGIELPAGEGTTITLAERDYGTSFQSFAGQAFGESSGAPQNEKGFYLGIRHEVNHWLTFSGYADQYSFPAARFGTRQPTTGIDLLGLIEINPGRNWNSYLLIRNEKKENEYRYFPSEGAGAEQVILGETRRFSIRSHVDYGVSPEIRMRSRLEWARYLHASGEVETGIYLYQDLRVQLTSRFRVDTRITLFDTDSFHSRLYQFESDLLYVLSNIALYNRGQRSYAVLKYKATDFVEFWLKYALIVFEDAHTIGSGLEEINGNRKNSIGIQVRIRI